VKKTFLLLAIFLIGCSGSKFDKGDDTPDTSGPAVVSSTINCSIEPCPIALKLLTSSWSRSDGQMTFNLSGFNSGFVKPVEVVFPTGVCECQASFAYDSLMNSTGNLKFSSCVQTKGAPPTCSSQNFSASFRIDNYALKICKSATECSSFN
jgi:hypothetical protein